MYSIQTANYNDHMVRFVKLENEWWASYYDVLTALEIMHDDEKNIAEESFKLADIPEWEGENKLINELGIYELLMLHPNGKKFRYWTSGTLQKLRKIERLEGYEVFRMTESDVQEDIDYILDSIYWDDEKKCLMRSITVQGGDVEQIPFDDSIDA